jgi:hypothetical protein
MGRLNRRPLLLGVVQEQRKQEPHKGKEQHDSRYSVQHKKRKGRRKNEAGLSSPEEIPLQEPPKNL